MTILLDSANYFVEGYIGREIASSTYTEYADGDGQREILLVNYPVTSITSFDYNSGTLETPVWTTIDPELFKLSPKVGKIFLTFYKIRGFQNYKIVYVA